MLKKTILLLLISAASHWCGAQPLTADMEIMRNRLYQEVIQFKEIESRYTGCWGTGSTIFLKTDSLVRICGPKVFVQYFNDPSYVLKYYAFMNMLYRLNNDSLVFQSFSSKIKDTTIVFCNVAGLFSGTAPFNALLAMEYRHYLKARYYYGGTGTCRSYAFFFPKPDKHLYHKKLKVLETMLKENSIDIKAMH